MEKPTPPASSGLFGLDWLLNFRLERFAANRLP